MKTKCPDCCYPEILDSDACGCCEGVEAVTPLPTANRPGLSKLVYRIGTHASFLETMMARLSSSDYSELSGLTTRDAADPSIALLDAWATVADVLTFYQERIANEGYLRSATERRSILELARLVGYKLRPGVSSSVFLAYTIDQNTKGETTIPAGSRAQSIPGPDELPQSFETGEDLKARAKWNNLKPRITQPRIPEANADNLNDPRVYIKGINTNLKPNDPLLIVVGDDTPTPYRVKEVKPDAIADRTLITLQEQEKQEKVLLDPVQLIKALTLRPSLQPRNTLRLGRKLDDQFMVKAETGYQTVSSFTPQLRETLVTAAANANVADESGIKVYRLQVKAPLFGHNIPRRTTIPVDGGVIGDGGDWPIIETIGTGTGVVAVESTQIAHEEEDKIYLDAPYDSILPGSWMIIETQETSRLTDKKTYIVKVNNVDASQNRSKYGASAPTTSIEIDFLDGPDTRWIKISDNLDLPSDVIKGDDFHVLRSTTVHAQPEELELAEEPIEAPVCGGTDELLELDGFYEGLESGRWIIVSGERDIPGTSGVRFSEMAMLSTVEHRVKEEILPGDKIHTFIKLAKELAYCFKRDTVTIYGNVVKATHGETRKEVLGSGDGSKALQSFDLKQSPLTHVSASNPTGVDSTLSVFVNDVEWHETDSLAGLHATDRNFVTKTDYDSKTSVIFGNGRKGARLPTGIENIRAEYRNGIGKGGNVNAEQISLLATKPLGVKEVINPLRASSGADRENRDQARKNAPLAVKALDRLVSVQDYEDFARIYAGIGKAHAVEMTDGRRQIVHVTIAGADDIPIDETSDLFMNLRQALHDFGDPFQPIRLAVRELMMIVISARVRILPNYQWEPVVANLRAALLDAFGFERRELGQDVVLSEVISVIQAVRGVAYVDVDTFGGIPEKIAEENGNRRLLTPDEVSEAVACLTTEWSYDDMDTFCATATANIECTKFENCKKYGHFGKKSSVNQRLPVNLADFEQGAIRPAQLAFLAPDVPDTLILNRIE
ncbi:MAG: putative baseplate assembly protein [Deltaproteobacteria bacterium]|nr:putative baseplate assembly protein [Deltaproteobacteria bacterium]